MFPVQQQQQLQQQQQQWQEQRRVLLSALEPLSPKEIIMFKVPSYEIPSLKDVAGTCVCACFDLCGVCLALMH